MSVRSFHSVFMVGGVAAAALGCYLVSLRVASERAALEGVETQIVLAQRDIRLLQTEIGTRGRLAQLERWNVRVLALSAPTADQFVADGFQLAQLVAPEKKPAIDAPVVYASAPAAPPPTVLGSDDGQAQSGQLLHEAGFKLPERAAGAKTGGNDIKAAPPKARPAAPAASDSKSRLATTEKPKAVAAAPSRPKPAEARPVKVARADPLAPLPSAKASPATTRDSGKTQ